MQERRSLNSGESNGSIYERASSPQGARKRASFCLARKEPTLRFRHKLV